MLIRILPFSAISLLLFLFAACQGETRMGIPERIGGWRVEVGPPGNEFYQAPAPAGEVSPPSDVMF